MSLPRLLLLTDRSELPAGRNLVETLAACAAAGATHVVLRELDLPAAERARLADGLVGVGATVIAAHEPLPACVGVHLPASGLVTVAAQPPRPSAAAEVEERALRASRDRSAVLVEPAEPPGEAVSRPPLVGRSCHSVAEVRAATADGVDYVTLSPFAATDSKPGYGPPVPPDAYFDHSLPVYALGGVTPGNAAKAVDAGAYGVAVMGAVMRADDPAAVVRSLLREVAA